MPQVILTLAEFAEQQKCTPILLRGRYLFPNGAESDGHANHIDPPTDAAELRRLKLEYFEAKLADTIERYNQDKAAVAAQLQFHQLGAGPAPGEGWEDHLKKLGKEIESLERKIEKLQQERPVAHATANYHARRARERQEASEGFSKLDKLPNY